MQLQDFLELLGKETGLAPGELEILAGFPPAPIALPSSAGSRLSSLAVVNGDTLLIRKRAETAQAPDVPSNAQAPAAAASDGLEVSLGYHPFSQICWETCSKQTNGNALAANLLPLADWL